MKLQLKKAESQKDIREFLTFAARLNQNNPEFIQPLFQDIEKVFDPEKNKFFRNGACERFLVLDEESGETVGKYAVFTMAKYQQDQPTGGIGFVDFIDNQSVSKFIFDSAKEWLKKRGMEAMDGPINFGERDTWWGLLVEGFHEPLYGMNYNLPYYQKHFEDYGFQVYFHQLCFGRKIDDHLSEGFKQAHQRLSQNPDIRLEQIHPNNLEKYAKDFAEVYNKAWASHGQGKTLSEQQTLRMFKSMKAALDPRIAFIAYEGEKPIAIWINLPDLNQWFKKFKGKLNLMNKIRFLYFKSRKNNTRMTGLVFGVIPEWQGKGVDGFMIYEGRVRFPRDTEYIDYEMQWIGDFNPKMVKIANQLETRLTRRLSTYRYLFNRELPFNRHPIL